MDFSLHPINFQFRPTGDFSGIDIPDGVQGQCFYGVASVDEESKSVSTVIPSVARNPGYLTLLANRSVLGIPFDTIFDRRACFTPLALHAYGDAAFTPKAGLWP